MKRVLKPYQREEAVYYSDFGGKCFGKLGPEVNLLLSFDYGSKYDGEYLDLDLSDEEAESVLEFIKSKISEDCKETFRKKLVEKQTNLDDSVDSVDSRDCTQSEHYTNSCNLYKFLLK